VRRDGEGVKVLGIRIACIFLVESAMSVFSVRSMAEGLFQGRVSKSMDCEWKRS
jgi:hypothetical protein